jgi:ribosome recycling factor
MVPSLSEERRKKMVSHVKELAEKSKLAMRNARRDANKVTDTEQKSGEITEDDAKKCKEQLNELIHKYEERVNAALQKKTNELMTV